MALGAGAPPPPLIFSSLCCAELYILNSGLESSPLPNHVPTLLVHSHNKTDLDHNQCGEWGECSAHAPRVYSAHGNMESRGVAFGLGAAVGLSTAVLIDKWWRQRDRDDLPHLSNGQQLQQGNSKYFK